MLRKKDSELNLDNILSKFFAKDIMKSWKFDQYKIRVLFFVTTVRYEKGTNKKKKTKQPTSTMKKLTKKSKSTKKLATKTT